MRADWRWQKQSARPLAFNRKAKLLGNKQTHSYATVGCEERDQVRRPRWRQPAQHKSSNVTYPADPRSPLTQPNRETRYPLIPANLIIILNYSRFYLYSWDRRVFNYTILYIDDEGFLEINSSRPDVVLNLNLIYCCCWSLLLSNNPGFILLITFQLLWNPKYIEK